MSNPNTAAFLGEYAETLFPEALLERFVPVELMSESGIGQTFLCRDARGGGLIVAKRCDARIAQTEADMLKRLSHPGLSAFAGFMESGDGAFVLREYVPGLPLDHFARAPLSEARALDIIESALDILGYLHGQNPPVIHRDVKPSNIIVDPDTGRVSLIDFGIARSFAQGEKGDTVCMGTRSFAPPEQYGFMQTDPRADVYATGMVLKWLLTGALDVPPGGSLGRIIRRMTAFDPGRRYPDARAALRAIRRFRARFARKAALAAASVFAAVGLTAFGFWLGRYTKVPVAPLAALFEHNQAVAFDDPVLEARVRSLMGKDEGAVTAREALEAAKLDLSAPSPQAPMEQRITDIRALSGFVNLRSLDLSWNAVEDIAPLAGLTKLETLHLNGNGGITDLTPLKGLTNMKDIMLVGCQVFSDSAENFREMGGLTSFWVESPRLKEIGVVRFFPALERLVIKNCSVRDISPVTQLYNLRQIDVSDNPVEDLTPLLKLAHLAYATFSEDQRALVEAQLSGASFDINYA